MVKAPSPHLPRTGTGDGEGAQLSCPCEEISGRERRSNQVEEEVMGLQGDTDRKIKRLERELFDVEASIERLDLDEKGNHSIGIRLLKKERDRLARLIS